VLNKCWKSICEKGHFISNTLSPIFFIGKKQAHRYEKAQKKLKEEKKLRKLQMDAEQKKHVQIDNKGMDRRGKRLTREQFKEQGNRYQNAGQANAKPLGPYVSGKYSKNIVIANSPAPFV
jgi:hypothetical protein